MSNSKFKKFNFLLSQYQKRIDSKLEKFFNSKIKETSKISPLTTRDTQLLKDYVLRKGKRLRPILVNVGYFLAGGKNKKEILKASLAVELTHNFLLIHDDIIDQDDFRRGKPSLHCLYQKLFKNSHLGIALAMLNGDISNTLGYEILINSNFPTKNKIKAINILNETIKKTGYGEMLELSLKEKFTKGKIITEKDILKIYQYKTAYYSFIGPLKIGVALVGRNDKLLKILESFALFLGLAFQIQDDILGLFSSQQITGKLVASDIKEGQPNLLIFKSLTLASSKDRNKFKSYLNKDISQKEIKGIKKIVKKSGALEYCQQKAKNFIQEAKYSLKKMKLPKNQKQFLLDLADYLIIRNY